MRRIACAALLSLLAGTASANMLEKTVRDFTVIQNREGAARVLVKWRGNELPEGAVILRATLEFELSGAQEERDVRVWVRSVNRSWERGNVTWTSGWTRPGGDFDDTIYAWGDVSFRDGKGRGTVDVTMLVKNAVEAGTFADGFLVTVDPAHGDGFRVQDVDRLAGLGSARVTVDWRRMRPLRTPGRGQG